jgi:hypothetical protein
MLGLNENGVGLASQRRAESLARQSCCPPTEHAEIGTHDNDTEQIHSAPSFKLLESPNGDVLEESDVRVFTGD